MKVQPINSPNFGKIYYGADNTALTKTQKDVVNDIETYAAEGDYVKKLEKLNYDIYIEPAKNPYAMEIAFLKNARFNKSENFIFDKVVRMGAYIADTSVKYKLGGLDYVYKTELIPERFNKFFKCESINKYKRFLNFL